VNSVGGLLVGMIQKKWTVAESLRLFTLLAVGDG